MNPEPIDLPHGAQIIFNELYATSDPRLLRQDLLSVKLADGSFLDVGWYPQFDPSGCFKVTQYDSAWTNALQIYRTRAIKEVVKIVEWIAKSPSSCRQEHQPTSCTSTQRAAYPAEYPQSFASSV